MQKEIFILAINQMINASVVGVFRTILIILIIYYVIKWLTRLFFPLLMKKYFGSQRNAQQKEDRPEGDMTILKRGEKPKGDDNKLGDYVDYEEVDE
jgi:uncharacterized protein HemY